MGYVADNAAGVSKQRWRLIEIQFSPEMYFTDCPGAIEWDGHTWIPHGVTVTGITNPDTGPTMAFTVADADQYVFPFLNATGGAEGLIVNAWVAEFAPANATAVPDDAVQIFTGRVTSSRKNASGTDQVEFSCGPPALTTSINVPTRTFGSLARANP